MCIKMYIKDLKPVNEDFLILKEFNKINNQIYFIDDFIAKYHTAIKLEKKNNWYELKPVILIGENEKEISIKDFCGNEKEENLFMRDLIRNFEEFISENEYEFESKSVIEFLKDKEFDDGYYSVEENSFEFEVFKSFKIKGKLAEGICYGNIIMYLEVLDINNNKILDLPPIGVGLFEVENENIKSEEEIQEYINMIFCEFLSVLNESEVSQYIKESINHFFNK